MDRLIKKLIKLIKGHDKKCPDCDKVFLGVDINGSCKTGGGNPLYLGLKPYPLKCGKCPRCALECYDNLLEFAEEHGRIPCIDAKIDNYDDIDYFLREMKDLYLECYMYCDDNSHSNEIRLGVLERRDG